MLDFSGLNWLGILAALVAHMILGAVWFGVFAKPWAAMAHPGRTQEEIQKGPKWIYGIAAFGGLVSAIVLFAILGATGATTLMDAWGTTLAVWFGFIATKFATTYAFAWKPWKLYLIDVGYIFVSMMTAGTIFALWP